MPNQKVRKIAAVLLCFVFLVSLTSCYDYEELDDLTYVSTIGIDKGIEDKWRLTIQFPTMKEQGGGGSGMSQGGGSGGGAQTQGEYTYANVDAPTFYTGITMLNTVIPRRISLLHTKLIVISEDLARSGQLGKFLAPLIRSRQIRRTVHLAINKGMATEFIKENKPYIGTNLPKNLELILNEWKITGFFPHETIYDFYNALKSTYRQPIGILTAINNNNVYNDSVESSSGRLDKTGGQYTAGELPRQSDNKIDFFGSAIFDGDKMVGELTGEKLRLALIAKGDFKRSSFTIGDPNKSGAAIPLDVSLKEKPGVKVRCFPPGPKIDLKIKLEGDILAIQSGLAYDEDKKLKHQLEAAFSKYVKKGVEDLLKECQNLGVDIFGFGRHAVGNFLTIQEWEQYNWLKRFKNAQFTVEVGFNIRRTGTQVRSAPINKSEGSK